MSINRTAIPLCRSPFLQDVTIALGCRSLKSLRQAHPTLTFDVRDDEVNGIIYERLDIEARTVLGSMTKITLWEDTNSWIYFSERRGKSLRSSAFEVHASLTGMNVEDVAELIRATLRDLKSVENVWREHAISA